MIYPPKISELLAAIKHTAPSNGNAVGSDANFSCGSFVRFRLLIDKDDLEVANVSFSSNGCGYMLASAEILSNAVSGRKLSELHGLDSATLSGSTASRLGDIGPGRSECIQVVSNALRNAFADFRSRQIEEFRGEKALICTCFGITEESIENAIRAGGLRTVEDVSSLTNAGSGCGSCRMLIQEMLDGR